MARSCPRELHSLFLITIAPSLILASALIFSGCARISQVWEGTSATPRTAEDTTTTPTELKQERGPELEGGATVSVRPLDLDAAGEIEVTWAVPDESVDSYVLHYGFSREDLDQELLIDVVTLETTTNTQHQPMYRYVLRNIPVHKNVYVALSAVRAGGVSPMTDIIEVQRLPGTRN